jgi:pyruvyl transferase EpsI
MPERIIFLCNFIQFVSSKRNIGDQLQHFSIARWLRRHYPENPVEEVLFFTPLPRLKQIVKPGDIIVFQSSAGLGDLYPYFEEYRLRICRTFPENRIIVFPHTVFFQDPKNMEPSRVEYEKHPRLTIMARDLKSFDTLRALAPSCHVLPMPDVVLDLRGICPVDPERREGGLGILRWDEEINSAGQKQVLGLMPDLERYDLMFPETRDCNEMEQPEFVARVFGHIAAHEFVVTDRMHGMIFCAILGVPCVCIAGKPEIGYHKNQAMYESWLSRVPYVAFLHNEEIESRLLPTIRSVVERRDDANPSFERLDVDDPSIRATLFPCRGVDDREGMLINFDFLFHHYLPEALGRDLAVMPGR